MRTTIDLDDRQIRDLMRLLRVRTKREAIHRAMDECLRRGRAGELLALEGKVRFDLDWHEMEGLELGEKRPRRAGRR
jgi:Arc/MetJ family transcription regulator